MLPKERAGDLQSQILRTGAFHLKALFKLLHLTEITQLNYIYFFYFLSTCRHLGRIISVRETWKSHTLFCTSGCSMRLRPREVWAVIRYLFFVTTQSRSFWQTSSGLRRPVLSYNKSDIIHSHGGQGEAGSLKLLTIIQNSRFCWVLTIDQIFQLLRGCQMDWFELYLFIDFYQKSKEFVK